MTPANPEMNAATALPTRPMYADDESARAAAHGLRDRVADRAARCDAAVADVVAEYDRAMTTLAAAREATDRLARAVRMRSDEFDAVDRRSERSLELATAVLAEEYDRLCALPSVANVTLTEDAIVITTRDLIVGIGAQHWNIGPYRVSIPRNGGVGAVKIKSVRGNVVPENNNASHPHVFQSNICWGNLEAPMTQALRDAEFDVAFQYVLLLLNTPQPEGEHGGPYREILKKIGRKVEKS